MHWIRQAGSSSYDYAWATAPDGAGGAYVTGMTMGNLGGSTLGFPNAWLARYDGVGSQLWIRHIGASITNEAHAAAPDGSGGVYIGGTTGGLLGGSSAGGDDAWLAHYDSSGNQVWLRQFGSTGNEHVYGAAADGSGGVFMTGTTTGSLGGANAGLRDAWLARYDSAGNQLWLRQLGTGTEDYSWAAALDGSGGVYMSGFTSGALGGTSSGGVDAWFAHYDSAGSQLWIRQVGTSANDYAYGAGADGAGGVYVCGSTGGSLGGTHVGSDDAWLARYDSAGNQVWARQLGTFNVDDCRSATADGSGGVCICGSTLASLGSTTFGSWDAWLAGYDGNGNQLWVRQLGTVMGESADAGSTDGFGGVYFCGSTGGSLGGQNVGQQDAWLARYGPSSGTLLCGPGVGGVLACPCLNPPAGSGRGCGNSSATGGATLFAVGAPQLSNDTLSLTAQGEVPSASSVLLQGTVEVSTGTVFGQGVRCAGGTLKRLSLRAASAGAVTMPDFGMGDLSISARSAALGDTILPGQSRWYAVYYRDPVVLGGCPSLSTFNTGPTLRADWIP